MRREVPLIITFVVGMITLLSTLFGSTGEGPFFIKVWADELGNWVIIVSAFAVGLATVNLFRIHGAVVSRQRPGWVNSITLIIAIFVWATLGIIARMGGPEAIVKLNEKMYEKVMAPLGAAMFAILAFYVASAAYRAFRLRNLEASILLVSAVLIMLGKAPVGELMWSQFPTVSNWIFDVPTMVGQRAIMIGSAIGAFATALRILLGLERGHLGGVE